MPDAADSAAVSPFAAEGSDLERRPGLRSPGLLARWPLIGLLMVLLGGTAFGLIVLGLQTNGPLVQQDASLSDQVHQVALQSSPFLQQVMIFGYYLGQEIIVAIAAVLVLYFLWRRFWPELFMVVISLGGEGLIWLVLSGTYARPRPVFATPVWHQMTSPSFPSGHSMAAVLCYGLLAYLLVPRIHSTFGKVVVVLVALLIIVYIGVSRVFVGDHYPTDVLAGDALGVAWAGLVNTPIEWIAKMKRRNIHGQET